MIYDEQNLEGAWRFLFKEYSKGVPNRWDGDYNLYMGMNWLRDWSSERKGGTETSRINEILNIQPWYNTDTGVKTLEIEMRNLFWGDVWSKEYTFQELLDLTEISDKKEELFSIYWENSTRILED